MIEDKYLNLIERWVIYWRKLFSETWALPFIVLVAVVAYAILAAVFYNMDAWFFFTFSPQHHSKSHDKMIYNDKRIYNAKGDIPDEIQQDINNVKSSIFVRLALH